MIDAQSIVVASTATALVRPRGRDPALRLLPQPGPGGPDGPLRPPPGLRLPLHQARRAIEHGPSHRPDPDPGRGCHR
ncbi:MAG: hypothetical protein MZU79_07535 [Anaerotruncus sp.]|nr:hypothetical protein [Anaerotruncus sp.]